MDKVDVVIIGAGVIGLALARALSQKGRDVLLLEEEKSVGSVTSSRNSGVIHAGIYYNPGSLKARLCREGRDRLYHFAAERGLPHQRCGKLVVATSPNQENDLRQWKARAEQNGVTDMRLLSSADVRQLEPEVSCVAALLSPSTGILDVHPYLWALLADAEGAGATLALQSPVLRTAIQDDGFIVDVGGAMPITIHCQVLINAAGLKAQDVAQHMQGFSPSKIPPLVLAKGNYFSLTGKAPFKRLIYPLPVLGSSGLHATCDLGGRVRFGPDVEWVDAIDYRVNEKRLPLFEQAIRSYWPGLPAGALQPDYCGIRPKIARASPHDTDFVIQTSKDHGIPNLIHLFGIESPGLTSSLALADEVTQRLD